MDSVLSFHMNGLTCGVAKFNHRLASELGVPIHQIFHEDAVTCAEPLLSIKISEFSPLDIDHLARLLDSVPWGDRYRIFLHAWSGTEIENRMLREAREVFCGNTELAGQLVELRSDVQAVWCPGTLDDAREFDLSELTVFTMGMAHKIRSRHYHRLKDLLDATGAPYSLYLSTALHENTSFDEEFSMAFEELRTIFGDDVHFLGYLSDSAVYNYLKQTDYFAAFFDHGVRANNTSVNLAMQCGSVVITNLDEHSPGSLVPMHNVIDIKTCDELPTDAALLDQIGQNADQIVHERYGWKALERRLRGGPEPLPGTTVSAGGPGNEVNE
ncbi:MAG TPA: hypothetical protein QGG47_03105 [Acidobacteriota bacterium]|nr:hypothetical protein [Acidobacteriota bacterium]